MLVGIMNSCYATDKPTCKPPIIVAVIHIVWMLIASKHRYVKSNDLPNGVMGAKRRKIFCCIIPWTTRFVVLHNDLSPRWMCVMLGLLRYKCHAMKNVNTGISLTHHETRSSLSSCLYRTCR